MRPTLEPGDRLLLDPRAYRRRPPVIGDVVVVVDPELPERWLIKRVAGYDPVSGRVDVRGDATGVARDSRDFGAVPRSAIVGRAYRLYFPADRRREL